VEDHYFLIGELADQGGNGVVEGVGGSMDGGEDVSADVIL
jgi:hypothetical protein